MWPKGKPRSQATRDRISATFKDTVCTPERNRRHSEALKGKPSGALGKRWKTNKRRDNFGPRNPNWQGGITAEHFRVRNSPEYKAWRQSVFERDNWTCVLCGDRSRKGHKIRIHADHIKPFAEFPELRFELSNGRTLCKPCHKATPTYGVNKGKKSRKLSADRDHVSAQVILGRAERLQGLTRAIAPCVP